MKDFVKFFRLPGTAKLCSGLYAAVLAAAIIFAFTACEGPVGPEGIRGPDGTPGETPTITISAGGTWVINGADTGLPASGQTPTITINADGYWVINGEVTELPALGTQGPPGPTPAATFTVTFFVYDEEPWLTQQVVAGGWAVPPPNPVLPGTSSPDLDGLTAGLYTGGDYTFEGWYLDGTVTRFNFDFPVTENIALVAEWGLPEPTLIDLTGTAGATIIDRAFNFVNANPGSYYLLLDGNVTITGVARSLTANNARLTLIGLGSERRITLSSNGIMFNVGAAFTAGTNIELTLGENITLVGRTSGVDGSTMDNWDPLIQVRSGASLTMLDGSRITGNTSTWGSLASAVHVTGTNSTFTMKGGTITENTNTGTGSAIGGAVSAVTNSRVILEGGSITGNTGVVGDVYISENSNITLSGNARVGVLTLNATAAVNAIVTIDSAWDIPLPNITLNLRGNSATLDPAVINMWEGSQVLRPADGQAITVAHVLRFSLGNFISIAATANTQPIAPRTIGIFGANLGRLSAL